MRLCRADATERTLMMNRSALPLDVIKVIELAQNLAAFGNEDRAIGLDVIY